MPRYWASLKENLHRQREDIADIREMIKEDIERRRTEIEPLEHSAENLLNDPDNRAYLAGSYLDNLRETLREQSSALGRSLTMVLVVLVAFELLARAAIAKANVGPFEVSDLSLIQKALPVIGSYLFYDITNIVRLGGEMNGVYKRILERLHPDFAGTDLLLLIVPHRTSLWPLRMPGAKDSSLHQMLTFLLRMLSYYMIPFWLVYAYTINFHRFHLTDISLWAAVILSVMLFTFGFAIASAPHQKAG